MEVHHHSHTPRKKWTHYFWEFLMLFLAVFSGFLAENWREHIVEHQRANIYASSLYKELKKDTVQLNHLITWTLDNSKRFDTLCMLASERPKGVTNGKLYYYSGFTGSSVFFSSRNSTLEQLKSSGNLRIMNTEIALKLSDYDKSIKDLESDYTFFKTEYETITGLRLKIFDGITSVNLFTGRDKRRDSVFQLDPPLLNDDPKLMKEFIGWVKSEGNWWRSNVRDNLNPLKEQATELISLLQKEYHLE
jgi:hypothetical protein